MASQVTLKELPLSAAEFLYANFRVRRLLESMRSTYNGYLPYAVDRSSFRMVFTPRCQPAIQFVMVHDDGTGVVDSFVLDPDRVAAHKAAVIEARLDREVR